MLMVIIMAMKLLVDSDYDCEDAICLPSWCFTSPETVRLIRDGGIKG